MNILHLTTALTFRGGEQQLLYLINELNNIQSNNNQILVTYKKSVLCTQHRPPIPVLTLPVTATFSFQNAFFLKKICTQHNIEIIHLHDANAHNLAILSAVLCHHTTPLILSRKVAFLPLKRNFWTAYKYNHPHIKKIICISEIVKKQLQNIVKQPLKIEVIPDCVPIHAFNTTLKTQKLLHQHDLPLNTITIGSIAALAPEKDHFTFLKTAQFLTQNYPNIPFHFFIAGEGVLKKQIQDFILQNNLQKCVTLLGFVKNVDELIKQLNVLLVTSTTEGLCSTILQAFAAQVPVVATQVGGIPEIVYHQKTGLLAPKKDYKELANNVLKIINEPIFAQKIIQKASHFVQQFDCTIIAQKTFNCYQK